MSSYDPLRALAALRHEFGEHGGVNMSVEASTTFTVMQSLTMPELFNGEKGPLQGGCYLYGRHFNPTVFNLGRQLAALEGTEAAYCTASGMSAIAAVILQLCDAGDHIVASNTIYGGSYALMHDLLPQKADITTSFVDIGHLGAVEAAINERTRVIYVESLANPTLRVADIPGLSRIARRHGLKLVVDNTFSPLVLTPKLLGADIVVHSLTKFINGASDHIAGAVCANESFIQQLMDLHGGTLMLLGPTMDPEVAFHISLRVPHLALRMQAHSERAQVFAERLDAAGIAVNYPGLSGHPDHALLAKMHNAAYGYGGIFTLDLGTAARADELLDLLQNRYHFGYVAVSLGYFDTLMSCSGSSTSSEMTDTDLAAARISPGLIRISVGYTGTLEQRWSELRDALAQVGVLTQSLPC